ncbi:hypothetical protein ACXR6G_07875 [Ancylomarina sp. YFZ004]
MNLGIYANYQLWPNDYIALDLLNGGEQYNSEYTQDEKDRFIKHMNICAAKIDLDAEEFKTAFLSLYANPIK